MADSSDPRPPLPAWILECYEHLCAQACEPDHESVDIPALKRVEALETLLADCDVTLEPEDAEYAISRLLDRGYLYEVGSELRVTEPDKQCPP
ncbi:hypothetical protein ACYJ1Y_16120 [Natrialbaceae archaeon A-gly3]